MKKLIGLLAAGSICMIAACSSDDDENTLVPQSWQQGNNQLTQDDCNAFGPGFVLQYNAQTGVPECVYGAATSSDANQTLSSSGADPFAQVPASSGGITPIGGNASSSSAVIVAPTVSSSSVAPPVTTPSSSSVKQTTTPTTPTTPAVDEDDGLFKIGLWDGSTGSNQVPTGNSNGGYWYSYTDSGNDGASTLTWDATAKPGSTYSDDDLSPIIEECGGLCGSFDLVAGGNTDCAPYVAVAFNYAKTDKTSADATASKGLCITYKSSMDIEVDLGLGSKDGTYGYNLPAIVLDKSSSLVTVNALWSQFKQQWEGAKDLTGPEAAAMLAAIKFQIKGTETGEDGGTGTFLITQVGPYNGCK